MRYFLIFILQIELIFLSFYHQFPASSSREFALKPGFRAQTGHSLAALSSSWTYRTIFWTYQTILMPDTSAISIIFDRTDNAAFSRIAKGSANRFFALRLTAPREGYLDASMRRGLWFFLILAAGFRATPASPPDGHGGRCEPERGRAGDRRQPQPCRIDAAGAAGSWRRIVLSGIPKALNRSTPNVPKNKALCDRAFRKYCGEHHISPKKNISAKQSISAT
jgi:hypothetical protein